METIADDFLSNALIQLFDNIEENSKIKFNVFNKNSTESSGNIITTKQTYMREYEETYDNEKYKYLYDPNLTFDFRFHQRLSNINFNDRKEPWATIVFNTKEVSPVTNILSHKYTDYAYETVNNKTVGHKYTYRRQRVPVNMVIISNDIKYLYSTVEKINMYFDRFINFRYNSVINFSSSLQINFQETGYADKILPVDLNILDVERRGSIVSHAYTFDMSYNVIDYTPQGDVGLLEKIILKYTLVDNNVPFKIDIID